MSELFSATFFSLFSGAGGRPNSKRIGCFMCTISNRSGRLKADGRPNGIPVEERRTNSSMNEFDDENDQYKPLKYPKFILVDGLLKQNPEIREGVNLALKLLHNDSIALEIFRPLASEYGNIDDRDIIKAITIIREKGCRFNLYSGSEIFVSLQASFPLDDPPARLPEIGLHARYILLQSTDGARLSQKFLCIAKVLRAVSYLFTYNFTVLSDPNPQNSSSGKQAPRTPIRIGTVIVNGQLKGDAGRATEETLFGGRILPNPPIKVFETKDH
jgi:hypothetical protein